MSGDDIFFIVGDFVFDVEDEFFDFLTFFRTFFEDMVLLIADFFFVVAVEQIGVNSDKDVNGVRLIDEGNKFNDFLENDFPELLDRLDF